LKARLPSVRVVLADPVGSRLAGLVNAGALGPDGSYLVEGIGASAAPSVLDVTVIDRAESVSDRESFEMAHRLVREEGLLVGGSAGTAVSAALRVARAPDVHGPVVVVLADSWDRYQSRIFDARWMAAVP
jgi:cysteine synthase